MVRGLLPSLGSAYVAIALWGANSIAAGIVDPAIDPTTSLPVIMARWRDAEWQDPYRLPILDRRRRLPAWTSGSDGDVKSGTAGGALRPNLLLLQPVPGRELLEPLSSGETPLVQGIVSQDPAAVALPAALWLLASGAVALMAVRGPAARPLSRLTFLVDNAADLRLASAPPLTQPHEVSRD
jgi:hypothetical protein